MTDVPVVAIDGPAASGKGTLARRLAKHFGLRHLDTGLTYRAVADRLLAAGADLDDEDAAVAAAATLDLGELDAKRLADHAIGEAASRVAVMPRLRTALREKQRAFACAPPGAVLDGRDIGTVVFPGAPAKLYVTASPETRARRRALEMQTGGADISESRGSCGPEAARRARHGAGRFPPAAGLRRLLARYNRFGYRGRIPGGRRFRGPQDCERMKSVPSRVRSLFVSPAPPPLGTKIVAFGLG